MTTPSAEKQLAGFIAKFTPDIISKSVSAK
jgi:hypothetical protein